MAWQGNGIGAAWTRHAMCKSALRVHRTKSDSLFLKPLFLSMNPTRRIDFKSALTCQSFQLQSQLLCPTFCPCCLFLFHFASFNYILCHVVDGASLNSGDRKKIKKCLMAAATLALGTCILRRIEKFVVQSTVANTSYLRVS